ncbi:MAG: tRNA (adenosine(37)-N6)-threonylcarbamoyltransferase complex ATPase subunit type 1 TsaE [Deltaproteobacteria bacterium]|jgi:tRNA threonylcarbamoyladenosine biosynthesis protein TsaE|nr:tRNA (adenosine(37)-N6)-threonylcarbamoyltransferase complex ATPase subunit type 1 TsaE [Deltaproteobacteria bacterium]MBW2428676.1 tRNA (adenosine(37)-N6)-threonylcarbamoyltransferase complex ATPase subunit type 1 TsaE [Deltaproteobacteria bacterium]
MAEQHIQIITHSAAETQNLGRILGAAIEQAIIIALIGDLGSGKTAFVQGLAKGLDVSEKYYITSPTFTLINEYRGRLPFYHADLYRIEHISELEDLGLDEALHSDVVIAIEWAEKLSQDMLSNHLQLRLEIIGDNERRIDIFAYGLPAANLLKALELQLQDMIK